MSMCQFTISENDLNVAPSLITPEFLRCAFLLKAPVKLKILSFLKT